MTANESRLRIGHSPDPDDAFMWYALGDADRPPTIETGRYRFDHVLEDIESLNQRAERGELEITAMSVHAYPFVADRYILTSCGASMGDGYGPLVVGSGSVTVDRLPELTVGIPGERTTAFLAYRLLLRDAGAEAPRTKVLPFDTIPDAVARGEVDAGLIIHEGQLTYADHGLHRVVDLGEWWKRTRGLPLPLGANAIRRDLAHEAPAIVRVLLTAIRYALDHREEAVGHALRYARGLTRDVADRFIGMYVNDATVDYGSRGRRAVETLLREGADAGVLPAARLEFVEPDGESG